MGISATAVYDIHRYKTIVLRTQTVSPTDRYEILDTLSSFAQHCESYQGVARSVADVSALWGGPPYITYNVISKRFRAIVIWNEGPADFDLAFDVFHSLKRLEDAVAQHGDGLLKRDTASVNQVYVEAGYALRGDVAVTLPRANEAKPAPKRLSTARRSSLSEPKKKSSGGVFGRLFKSKENTNAPMLFKNSRPGESGLSAASEGNNSVPAQDGNLYDDAPPDLILADEVFAWADFGGPIGEHSEDLSWFEAILKRENEVKKRPRPPQLRPGAMTTTKITMPNAHDLLQPSIQSDENALLTPTATESQTNSISTGQFVPANPQAASAVIANVPTATGPPTLPTVGNAQTGNVQIPAAPGQLVVPTGSTGLGTPTSSRTPSDAQAQPAPSTQRSMPLPNTSQQPSQMPVSMQQRATNGQQSVPGMQRTPGMQPNTGIQSAPGMQPQQNVVQQNVVQQNVVQQNVVQQNMAQQQAHPAQMMAMQQRMAMMSVNQQRAQGYGAGPVGNAQAPVSTMNAQAMAQNSAQPGLVGARSMPVMQPTSNVSENPQSLEGSMNSGAKAMGGMSETPSQTPLSTGKSSLQTGSAAQSSADSSIPPALLALQAESDFDIAGLGELKDSGVSKRDSATGSLGSNMQQQQIGVDEQIRSRINEFIGTMQAGNFQFALQQILATLRFMSNVNPRRSKETLLCSNYALAQKILMRNAALEAELANIQAGSPHAVQRRVEAALLSMYLAELKHIQPRHRIAAMKVAVEKNVVVGNYGMSARWLRRLVEKSPASKKAEFQQKLDLCVRNGEQNSHMPPTNRLCYNSLKVIGTPYIKCTVCSAVYHPLFSGLLPGQVCGVCFVGATVSAV